MTVAGDTVVAPATPVGAVPGERTEGSWVTPVRRTGWVLLGLQLVVMLVFSTVEYRRFALSVGFGTYTQAWTAIAHGHLNPFSTLIGKSFWRNDSELILWPLALLYFVYPHSIDLLWVQDIAVVVTEMVAFGWILDIVTHRARHLPTGAAPGLAVAGLLALVLEPYSYQTIAYDFHSEVLSALFVVLSARALWSGRHRQLGLWIPLALATNGLAGLYVVGVGISGIGSGRSSRRAGTALVVVGVSWMAAVSVVGGDQFGFSHSLSGWYGYLVGPHHGAITSFDVLIGALTHPWAAVHMVLSKWQYILEFLLPVGLVGIASIWGWPVAVVVIVPSALNSNVAFVNPHASFQTWPALPFVLVGSVMVLVRLAEGTERARSAARVIVGTWAVSLVVLGVVLIPDVPRHWLAVGESTAGQLARVDAGTPQGDEVVASWGVVGRFGTRSDVYAYGPGSTSFPVGGRTVLFVLTPGSGTAEVSPAQAGRAVQKVRSLAGAQVISTTDGVYAVAWTPPPGTHRITLP